MTTATSVPPKKEVRASNASRETLLLCGIASSVLYILADIYAAMHWDRYSYASQSVSELMAIGAPTRPVIASAFTIFDILFIAFGAGVCLASAGKRSLQITSVLLVAYSVVGLFGCLLFPMHQRGSSGSLSDTMHIIITMALVLLMLLYMAIGSTALGSKFRWYSIATIVLMFVFGALAGMQGPRVASNLPTPWLGLEERINIYLTMLWTVVFAIVLLRKTRSASVIAARDEESMSRS